MNKKIGKINKGFSLAEALVSLALLGLILMMMTPVFVSRSSDRTTMTCIQGGVQTFTKNGIFDVKEGMTKLQITAVREGTSGYGNNAGDAYAVWTIPDQLNVAKENIKKIKINFSYDSPEIRTINSEGKEKKLKIEFEQNSTSGNHVGQETLVGNGIPDFGGFRGPLFGAGTVGGTTAKDLGEIVVIEWPTDCILSE